MRRVRQFPSFWQILTGRWAAMSAVYSRIEISGMGDARARAQYPR
jgi:hypothetical protein